jgi:hypothetical protein
MKLFMRSLLILVILLSSYALFAQNNTHARTYAPHSALANGNWYKIPILTKGIYKIDYSYLAALTGVNLSSINPANIRILGNGGGMLPQLNSTFRHDDLAENAIEVHTQNANTFNSGDYILFYGEGSDDWAYSSTQNNFVHKHNLYADTNFYFLNLDGNQAGLRINTAVSPTSGTQVTYLNGYAAHEIDKANPASSGRYWLGELFDYVENRTIGLYVPDATAGSSINVKVRVAAAADRATSMLLSVNGQSFGSIPMLKLFSGDDRYYASEKILNVSSDLVQGDSLRVTLTFEKNGSNTAKAWLDYIEANYTSSFSLTNAPKYFSLKDNTGAGKQSEISLSNGNDQYKIWNVTNAVKPENISYTHTNGTLTFRANTDSILHFVAFDGDYKTPLSPKKVENQDLHGQANVDYLIITHPDFAAQAERIGKFHQDELGHSYAITTPAKIYNEFSSGKLDVSAIRDYIKMFHDRSNGEYPKYVLLFGDGSYDCKNIDGSGKNFIPTYQSRLGYSVSNTFQSDDFYALLEDNEGFWGEASGIDGDTQIGKDNMDVAIGRFPVENLQEAEAVVDKIIHYVKDNDNFGDWKNSILFVGDFKEGENFHMEFLDSFEPNIKARNACFNIDKIYLDNYPVQTTASGTRYPEAKSAMLDKFDKGSLIVNYGGHGGETAWSNSALLEITDIQNMENANRLAAFMTATCEFGRFDLPEKRCGAEMLFLRENAGAIAMFTTVRLVYASDNKALNAQFYNFALSPDTALDRMLTVGEIMQRTKNAMYKGGSVNSRNFALLGDPGMTLAYPKLNALITEINQNPVILTEPDTIQPLSLVTVKGRVEDFGGNLQSNFSGALDVTIFDKPSQFITTHGFPFYWQKNKIFNGSASVQNGLFEFQFVVPIDISYEEGFGKISLYVYDSIRDGAGCFSKLFIGGSSTTSIIDEEPPFIQLFMNDTSWINGGTTNPDPDLYALISDNSGINLTGTGVGHEIVGIIDEDINQMFVLNDYYTTNPNSYASGSVRYKLRDLALGQHTLKLRVWDVANNPSEVETEFWLVDSTTASLSEIFNYPNPFSDFTNFKIGHNQAGKQLSLEVKILSQEGRVIKTLSADFVAEGNYYEQFVWNGESDQNEKMPAGLYMYQVILKEKGSEKAVVKSNKMVIVR